MSRKSYNNEKKRLIGERLRQVRKANNLSQTEYATALNTFPGYISEMETGKKMPGSDILFALKNNLKVNINWFITGIGDMFETSSTEPEKVAKPVGSYTPDVDELLKATEDILRSGNETIKSALKSNIIAFHYTVKCDKEIKNLKRDVDALKKILNPGNPNTKAKGS